MSGDEALTDASLTVAARALARREPRFREVLRRHGAPPLWAREPGYGTLIHIILEQQVSLASARAAYARLVEAAAPLTPERFLEFDDAQLKVIGFSRQKARYGREVSRRVLEGALDLEALHDLPDDVVRAALTQVPGIGPWTADVYLLMALRRRDVFPAGDLALLVAAQRLFDLPARPTPRALAALAESWRPHRAVAARLLWQVYLHS